MMRSSVIIKSVLVVVMVSVVAPVFAQPSIDLTLTIRDFKQAHPDFQYAISGVETGLVETALGGDYKPVYANKPGAISTTTAANFNQWYNDVPGTNLKITTPISLVDGDFDGIYNFSNTSFFPIDGMLWGNEGNPHNYHFTVEAHAEFVYNEFAPGQIVSATTDDDYWLFIDGQLVIDLGGVHGASTASVDLSTLGLTHGETYKIDLFFAERYLVASEYTISLPQFSDTIVPEPASMAIMGLGSLVVAAMRKRK